MECRKAFVHLSSNHPCCGLIPLKRMNNLTRETNVHNSVSELTRTIYDSAFKFFGHSHLIRDDIKLRAPLYSKLLSIKGISI
jgi:hypothetical protein